MLNTIMGKSTNIVKQKRLRGRPIEIGDKGANQFVGLRLTSALLESIDKWAADNDLSRSEAVRTLIERGLKAKR
jgi:hypothetical protein